MKSYLLILTALCLAGITYGCSSGAAQPAATVMTASSTTTTDATVADTATPEAVASTATTVAVSTPTDVAAAQGAGTPWVPPTALAGTAIPGAEATLTAAPQLAKATIIYTNSKGEQANMTVEVANDEPSRELGLMFRPSMGLDEGMLFDFGSDTTSGFWMANTILPLSIAFVQADGKIISVQDMQALDRTGISAPGPYRYAIEVNQGYFGAHNIAAGDHVTLPGAQSTLIPGMPGCPVSSQP